MEVTSFILGYKKGRADAGGSSGSGTATHPLHTVTFMSEDGAEVLYKRSVVDGDNCADVVARGLLETPTKESTVDKVFTYSGWAATAGGAASSSALSAVTEDRTVYAAYMSAVRYYTITYYDGDTVLKTESLAYGTMPSYTPRKEGYDFAAWTPELVAVTGNASYTAGWKKQAAFATATWEEITSLIADGTAANYFALGDKRTETLTYADGTTEDVEFEIVDTDASNIKTGAHFALLATHVLQTPMNFDNDTAYSTSLYYMYSDLFSHLETLVTYFPIDMQEAMISVSMPFSNGANKLHVPTIEQLGYDDKQESTTTTFVKGSTSHMLEAFANGKSLACKKVGGTNVEWWAANTAKKGITKSELYPVYCNTAGSLVLATTAITNRYVRLLFFI